MPDRRRPGMFCSCEFTAPRSPRVADPIQISHISDDRVNALSSSTNQFKAGTLHRARVIGHSPLDGVLLLSFEQKVLDQVFMQVDELQVGQVMKVYRLMVLCSFTDRD